MIFKYLSGGLGALLLLSNVTWYALYQSKENDLLEAVTAHEKTKSNYKEAQAFAEKMSLEEALKKERENAENARKADEVYNDLLSKYNASILRYQREAINRQTGSVHLSSTSSSSDGSYTESENTTISITLGDAGICAENTARLQAVREWALGLGAGDEKKSETKSD